MVQSTFKIADPHKQSWEIARAYAQIFRETPVPFTANFLRALMRDHLKHGQKLGRVGRHVISQILRAPTPRGCFVDVTATYHPKIATDRGSLGLEDYASIYSPYDMAAIVGFLYLFNRARHLCGDGFEETFRPMVGTLHLGALTGCAIANIGFGTGMISGGIHQMAMTSFYPNDKPGYAEYKRHLQKKDEIFDSEYELARWGCTSTQIGALLLQSSGFGLSVAIAFMTAFTRKYDSLPSSGQLAQAMRICWMWVDSLRKSGSIPNIVHDGNFYPSQSALHDLLVDANRPVPKNAFWLVSGRNGRLVGSLLDEEPSLASNGA